MAKHKTANYRQTLRLGQPPTYREQLDAMHLSFERLSHAYELQREALTLLDELAVDDATVTISRHGQGYHCGIVDYEEADAFRLEATGDTLLTALQSLKAQNDELAQEARDLDTVLNGTWPDAEEVGV